MIELYFTEALPLPVEGEPANTISYFKTPVIIANTGYRKGPSRKLSVRKPPPPPAHLAYSQKPRECSGAVPQAFLWLVLEVIYSRDQNIATRRKFKP
jgi:hypothetical protein